MWQHGGARNRPFRGNAWYSRGQTPPEHRREDAMAEIILHHYDRSPFSEKVRLVFGLKGVAWRSVDIPRWMPKPELMPLTGGYRKTPVMQIGADIYCDTRCILREVERRFPQPALYGAGGGELIGAWVDGALFTNDV